MLADLPECDRAVIILSRVSARAAGNDLEEISQHLERRGDPQGLFQ